MKLPRILIAGTHSGSGKTTVSCALLRAFTRRGLRAAAFKCGPDYIDPMFHKSVIGIPSRNLDAFLSGRSSVRKQLARNCAGADIAVIEGVMGLYDGISLRSDECSANDVAKLTDTPAVLVVNPGGMSLSAAALVEGFLNYRRNTVKAVILNGETDVNYYRGIIERETGVRVLGTLPRVDGAAIGSRHLGLIAAGEIENLSQKLNLLAKAAIQNIDIGELLLIADSAPDVEDYPPERRVKYRVRIAVADDAAFCFRYDDGMDALKRQGAELVRFSPLSDGDLPDNCSGLYLCGGYPELYLNELSANTKLLRNIRKAVRSGLPTVAECGGFMYLHSYIDGLPFAG
ncbi:MAG: cobyrinate a,c-diamide synthase, partial [Oscillospiraceae bacterium]|nr:cobyrinate a,c-diamide synthase [Oscillospiraceae bacterium]